MRLSPELNITEKDLFGYTLVLHQLNDLSGVNRTRLVINDRPREGRDFTINCIGAGFQIT